VSPEARRPLFIAPTPLAALVVLLVNDHVLKWHATSWLTGKLSDVAGLVCFPLLMLAVLEPVLGRPLRAARHAQLAVLVTGVGFAAVKLSPGVAAIYGLLWGAMQWPGFAAMAWLEGTAAPGFLAVSCVCDPTDLVALLALAIPGCAGQVAGHPSGADRGASHL
jgi:hypothetical protein